MWPGHTGPLTSGDLTNDATPALSGYRRAGAQSTSTTVIPYWGAQ
ncbi:hypothetical protein VXE06_17555 [Klebsiella oxytoca]